MNAKILLSVFTILFLIAPQEILGQDSEEASIEIMPSDTTIMVGDTLQFTARILADSTAIDTTFNWQVSDSSIAIIDDSGKLFAIAEGEVEISASFDSLEAVVELEIEEPEGDDDNERELRMVPGDTTIFVGEYLQLKVQYTDGSGWTDTTATFVLNDDELAVIQSGDSLLALKEGDLEVTATLDSLTATAEIEIEENSDDGNQELFISPSDTLVVIDAQVQFRAYFTEDSSQVADSLNWSISSEIGSIDSSGMATFTSVGFGFVDAEYNGINGRASIRVSQVVDDSTGVQQIIINVPRNNPNVAPATYEIEEGDVFRLKGFASPLNYLNGGTVFFTLGSITEDIRIEVSREDYTGTTEDGTPIVGGIGFDVFVNDSLISPYNFETPVEISIPFKRGLLSNLGIDATNLSIFNMEDTGDVDTTGVHSVVVDSLGGRIFGYVSHFSTYVLMPAGALTTSTEDEAIDIPDQITLNQNYPNPFNPTTTIGFNLPGNTTVNLTVYNVMGQRVATLIANQTLNAGSHSIQFDANNLASGLYIYRLTTGDQSFNKRMLLLK